MCVRKHIGTDQLKVCDSKYGHFLILSKEGLLKFRDFNSLLSIPLNINMESHAISQFMKALQVDYNTALLI